MKIRASKLQSLRVAEVKARVATWKGLAEDLEHLVEVLHTAEGKVRIENVPASRVLAINEDG